MPNIEDLEKLGSLALLIGNKTLPKELSQDDLDAFKSVFTDELMEESLKDNNLPSIDELDNLDDIENTENAKEETENKEDEDNTLDDLENILDNDDTESIKEDVENKENEDSTLDNLENILDNDDTESIKEDVENKENENSTLDNLENILDNDDTESVKEETENKENEDNTLDDLENILDDDKTSDNEIVENINDDKIDNKEEDTTLDNLENILDDNIEEVVDEADSNLDDLESILDDNNLDDNNKENNDIAENINNEEKSENIEDENVLEELGDLDLSDDKELEEELNLQLQEEENKNANDNIETLPEMDELPVPESLIDLEDIENDNNNEEENIDNDENTIEDSNEEAIQENDIQEENIENDTIEDNALDSLESVLDDEDNTENTTEEENNILEDNNDNIENDTIEEVEDNQELENIKEETEDNLDSNIENTENKEDTLIDANSLIDDDTLIDENPLDDILEDDIDSSLTETEENNNAAKVESIENKEDTSDNIIDDLDSDVPTLDNILEDENIYSNQESTENRLPPPELANNLGESRYGDIDKKLNHNKIISTIKELSPITRYHVLDSILNEKLDEKDMKDLLSHLEKKKSNKFITNFINEKLNLNITEKIKKNALDVIPVPQALKDYSDIIRISAAALVLFLGTVLLSYQFIYKPIMAKKFFEKGIVNIKDNSFEEAERNFARGDKLTPNNIKWYNKYANAYLDKGIFDKSYQKIEKALNIEPRNFDTRILFGMYYRKKGEKQLSEEDYIKGQELYNDMLSYTTKKKKVIKVYEDLGALLVSRAKNLNMPSYYDDALQTYADIINKYGDNIVSRKGALLVNIYKDNYNNVVELEKRINRMQKDYVDDFIFPKLAKYYLDKDKFYEARNLFEKLLKKYPRNLESIIGYADYEVRLKHYDKAKEILINNVLPIYQDNRAQSGEEFVYNMLGQIYYNVGEYANAINNFDKALEINSVYPDANYNLANLYFYQEKNYKKAKEHYKVAYDNLAPELRSELLLYNLSWLYYADKEYDKAFEGFNALFQKNPDNSVVSYALGNALLHLDRANLANGFYRNALNLALSKRDQKGRLEMRKESDFFLVSYLASLYNNIGVSYAYNSVEANTVENEKEAFKYFVLASEYFDQLRTSNIDLELSEKRTVVIENQNVGIGSYNVMSVQSRRNLKNAVIIDDYIPTDMFYVK